MDGPYWLVIAIITRQSSNNLNMTPELKQLLQAVKYMRQQQRRYFQSTKSNYLPLAERFKILTQAKEAEKQVDFLIEKLDLDSEQLIIF